MRTIKFKNPHRQKHFEFFNQMDQPHFSLCANVDITAFLQFIKKEKLPFTPSMVFCIAKTANEIKEFRYRIRGEKVVVHNSVHPSFTTATDDEEVFSFCTVDYHREYTVFKTAVLEMMERMRSNPSLEDEHGRDDYLFLSAIPWVSFTFLQHAMHYSPVDSIPRIAWGKFFEENGKTKMPLSVMAHHAVVDGIHMGRYFELIQEYFLKPWDVLKI